MIKQIIADIKTGELVRDDDETGASGFWDLAGELSRDEQQQEQIYNAFWTIYEEATK